MKAEQHDRRAPGSSKTCDAPDGKLSGDRAFVQSGAARRLSARAAGRLLLALPLLTACGSEGNASPEEMADRRTVEPAVETTFTSLFQLDSLVLEETPSVITVSPLLSSDQAGGILISDFREQQFRRYSTDGKLLWHFGSFGRRLGEFVSAIAIARLSPTELLAADFTGRGVIWNEATRQIVTDLPTLGEGHITGMLHVGHDTVLIQTPAYTKRTDALQLVDARTGKVIKSFFRPPVSTFTEDALPRGLGRTRSDIRGDTIASVFAYSDTVYLHRADGELMEKLPFPTRHFTLPQGKVDDFPSRRAWQKSHSEAWSVYWLQDGSLAVFYYRRGVAGGELTPALLGMERSGRSRFDVALPSPLRLVDADDVFYFDEPSTLLRNHLLAARIR